MCKKMFYQLPPVSPTYSDNILTVSSLIGDIYPVATITNLRRRRRSTKISLACINSYCRRRPIPLPHLIFVPMSFESSETQRSIKILYFTHARSSIFEYHREHCVFRCGSLSHWCHLPFVTSASNNLLIIIFFLFVNTRSSLRGDSFLHFSNYCVQI